MARQAAVEVEGHAIRVTSLDKILWPAGNGEPPITKGEMLAYYATVGPYMLPHLKDRPIAVMRYPEGLKGQSFFQHRWDVRLPSFVDKVEVYSLNSKKPRPWMMCNNLATLVWLAQHEAIEIHAWYSRTIVDEKGLTADFGTSEESMRGSALNYPDFMIIDLDPTSKNKTHFDEEGYRCTVDVALATKEVLDSVHLDSFIKTSGKTGLHIYVPMKRISRTTTCKRWQALSAARSTAFARKTSPWNSASTNDPPRRSSSTSIRTRSPKPSPASTP